jgi:site-specific recombinase XerD
MPVKLQTKPQRKQVDFPYAIRSFIGYLEGTKKSAHTIKNYRLDLKAFQSFLNQDSTHKLVKLEEVTRSDLERYRHFLKEKGLKINTRRRKILTVTQFLNYLAKRKKLSPEFAQKIPAPHKVERIPFTVSAQDLVSAILNLQEETVLDLRNKVLLWSLAETGCLVSEVTELKFEQWTMTPHGAFLRLVGKSSRSIPVTSELLQAVMTLKKTAKNSSWIFQGYNKFGSLGSPITPRGVELLVKHYGPILGFTELTPRTFRHSVILKWFQDGMPQNEIQTRLGLKTTYAFRSYEPLLKSKKGATSNSETTPTES